MLQNTCKTLGFKKIMVYEIPLWGRGVGECVCVWGGGGGKPYLARGLY